MRKALNDAVPLEFSNAGMLAVLQGESTLEGLNDITIDNDVYIPVKRNIIGYELQSTEINSAQKSCTLKLDKTDGYKWGNVFLEYILPAQYARKPHDAMHYDSLPGINCIRSITVSFNEVILETLTPQIIIKRLLDHFGLELFLEYAEKWWGGYKTDKHCSPNQKLHGILNNYFDAEKLESNVILEQVNVILPLPISLLMDNEKFCFDNAAGSPLKININFRDSEQFITYTKHTILQKMSTKVSVIIECLNPNEVGNYFNNLPYVNPDKDYYFKNSYYTELNAKLMCSLNEFKLPIAMDITNQLNVYVYDNLFEHQLLFGSTVLEATSNWIASLFSPFETQRSSNMVINLNTGCFENNEVDPTLQFNPKACSQVTITQYTNNSITLKWKKSSKFSNTLKITCDSRWKDIGSFYLDLNAYTTLMPSNSVCPQLFHLTSFNLKIVPFEQSELNLDNYADRSVQEQTSFILAKGYYTLGYDTTSKTNKYAFKGVNNIEKTVSDETWSYLISQKVPPTNNAMALVTNKFTNVTKNNFQYYDLDSINKIQIEHLTWQKGACQYEQEDANKLKYLRDVYSKENYFRAQLEIDYSFKDFKKNLNSKGFVDFFEKNITGMKIKIKPLSLSWDGSVIIIDAMKGDRAGHNGELTFTILQSCVRHMCYLGKEKRLSYISEEDRVNINEELYKNIFLKNNYQVQIQKIAEKRPKFSTRGESMSRSVTRSMKRSLQYNDEEEFRPIDSNETPPNKRRR